MHFRTLALSTVATFALSTGAFADMAHKIMIHDAYARASNKMAGAAFMEIMNHSGEDDRLISAQSDVAERVELHTHKEDANGVMRMIHVEEGFSIPAGETHALARGGDHVMFMGLRRELHDGDTVNVTLEFEHAGEVPVEITVDLQRQPKAHGHGGHDHSKHDHN